MKSLEKTYKSINKEVVFDKLSERKKTGGYRTVQQARDAAARQILFKSRHDPLYKNEHKRVLEEQAKSLIDPLTGLYNRLHLGYLVKNPTGTGELERKFIEASRSEHDLSALMIDIDNFKLYNDRHGHNEGDIVLQEVAKLIKKVIRTTDIPFRYGGEEFFILSPDTDIDGAKQLSKRLNEGIANMLGLKEKITVSIGFASFHNSNNEKKYREKIFPTQIKSEEDLVVKSDEALYFSKIKGKNMNTCGNEMSEDQSDEVKESRRKQKEKALAEENV